MASLSETIALLTNPAPTILDPEDDVNIETAAKVSNFNDDSDNTVYTRSELRNKAAVLLDDPAYAGKKVSRKSLDKIFRNDERSFSKYDRKSDNFSEEMGNDSDSDEQDEDDDDDDELSDSDLANFKSSVKDQQMLSDEGSEMDEESSESEASDVESNEDMTKRFSNIDVAGEKETAAHVKLQKELCNSVYGAFIRTHKLTNAANKLPQFDCWNMVKEIAGKEMSELMNKVSNSVKLSLNGGLDREAEIGQNLSEINASNQQETGKQSDEEIPSDTEEEMEETDDKEKKSLKIFKKTLKRKLKCDEYGEMLAKRCKFLIPYRDIIIQKWDEKTKLSSGRITQKSFSAFESSVLKQIEQVVQDESRIIKRTQLKRSFYKVFGKPDDSKIIENHENIECTSKQDMLLRDYDTEIFDDDDFYHQVLKEIIESKSVGIDPVILRKQMEIQSVRNKIKKKVDTKASKGRKIRYDVHQKLVDFMKKRETSTLSDDDRNYIVNNIFGKCPINS